MTRVEDRGRVREHDDAVAERLLREVFPETGTPHEPPIDRPPQKVSGRPIRWMRWLGATAAVVILAIVAAVVVTRDTGTSPEMIDVTPVGVFHTADWWEHQLSPAPVATPEFHTADWYEHQALTQPVTTPEFHTADWYEHQALTEPVATPEFHTADWYEHQALTP